MKTSKATKLLNQIKKTPLKYGEMQKFVWKLNGCPEGYVREWINTEEERKATGYYTKTKTVPMSRGYWCTNLSQLIFLQVIAKNPKTKTYHITEIGKLNIDKPFTRKDRQKLSLKAKLYRAEQRVKVLEHNYKSLDEWWKKRYDNKGSVSKALLVDIRQYVDMVTRGIH